MEIPRHLNSRRNMPHGLSLRQPKYLLNGLRISVFPKRQPDQTPRLLSRQKGELQKSERLISYDGADIRECRQSIRVLMKYGL
jgi:hypothetical protein